MRKVKLENLDCASCAARIEDGLAKMPEVTFVSVNAVNSILQIDTVDFEKAIRKIIEIEPNVKIVDQDDSTRVFENPTSVSSLKQGLAEHKSDLIKICITVVLLMGGVFFNAFLPDSAIRFAEYLIFIPAYLVSGWGVISRAVRSIARAQVFNEHFLMTLATLGAIAIGEFAEAVTVMLFYIIGELFQQIAVNRSRKSVKALLEIRPDFATLVDSSQVSPKDVHPGQWIVVKPGEKIPLDGVVKQGSSFVDTFALTGESVPRSVKENELVLAGMINKTSLLTIEVTREFSESSIAKILELVEHASSKKAETEKFITTFARYYTPAVVFGALLLALLPPLLIPNATFTEWIYRALVVLVISCPCALVISIPLAYFGGIGRASHHGILVKGSNFMDALASLNTVVFDKTGTLTRGEFKVSKIVTANGFDDKEMLRYAAHAEANSNHPIARSILESYHSSFPDEKILPNTILELTEIAGHGVQARLDGEKIVVGNDRLFALQQIDYDHVDTEGTVVHVAVNDRYAGYLIISDSLKDQAREAVRSLWEMNIETVMLTGDNRHIARTIAHELGINRYYAGLLPEEKVRHVEDLLHTQKEGKLAFVGDGINDAPVIARADVGIAMGALGSDAAVETADVVLMSDTPMQVVKAIDIARTTRKIVWQNITLALGIKFIFIILGTMGIATMWEAVFGDMGVALIAILNSVRGTHPSVLKTQS